MPEREYPDGATPEQVIADAYGDHDERGDPDATDIGDALEVPEDQRLDVDEDEPNEDADDDLADVEED